MSPFEIAFPGYIEAAAALHRALLPWSLVLFVLGMLVEFWHGMPTPAELIKTFLRIFLVLLVLAHSHTLINQGQTALHTWLETTIPARPENVAERFKEKLVEAQEAQETDDETFLEGIFDTQHLFESLLYALLTLIAWLAIAAMALVRGIQQALLLAAWGISPLLFPFLAIRPLSGIGMRHLLRIVGILLWPVGLALAATFSEGLIEVISSGTSFAGTSTLQAVGRGLTSLLGVVVLAIWILLSTFTAPLLIQRLLVGSPGPALAVARIGEILTHAVPSTATVTTLARATFHQGAVISAAVARLWQRPSRDPGVTRSSPSAPVLTSAENPASPPPTSSLDPTDPTAERAAQGAATRLKGR